MADVPHPASDADKVRASYALAVLIALCFVASAAGLAYYGNRYDTLHFRIAAEGKTTSSAAKLRAPASAVTRVQTRPGFAAELDRRYQARDQGPRVAVDAHDDRILQLRWPASPDPNYLKRLQSSEDFHHALHARGFERLEFYSGDKQIWSKHL